MKDKKSASAVLAAFASIATVQAATIQYDLPILSSYSSSLSDTFAGNGYVGMYRSSFGGLWGLEGSDFSRSALQVNVSALSGFTITSAFLTFNLLEGSAGSQNITVTRFSADGVLEHAFEPTDSLFQQTFTSRAGANSLDVTSFLTGELSEGSPSWLGLHLKGTNLYQWAYANPIDNPDRADVTLTVEYSQTTSAVPEPGNVLTVAGLLAAGMSFRSRNKRKA
jgi:hypothetical protein